MRSTLLDDFQTIYAGIMAARGHLALTLDVKQFSSITTTKLMELNHKMDEILMDSETILRASLDTRG